MKYEGILARRIDYQTAKRAASVLKSNQPNQARIALEAEYAMRVDALFAAHVVKRGNWQLLAIKLAVAHVPGFQIADARGPRTKWHPNERAALRVAIDAFRRQRPGHMSILEACRVFAKEEYWKAKLRARTGTKEGAEALLRQYYKADGQLVREVLKIREWGRTLTVGIAKTEKETRVVK